MSYFEPTTDPHTPATCGHTTNCNLVKHPRMWVYIRECRIDAAGEVIRS